LAFSVKRLLIGRPLKSTEINEQKLSNVKALAILSSDALSSVAYGPEQVIIVLATFSYLAIWYSLPIAFGILILLTALVLSYRQIIFAYPHGGGAYVVSKENLGAKPGLIAGGALLVDYILTVAVSVSSGADAIASAFPVLLPFKVEIAVSFIIFITILNLRGITESANVFAFPVYLFIFAILLLIGTSLYKIVTGAVPPETEVSVGTPVAGISLFLLLKAFASGCSALTGVEAISNAVPNFKDPAPANAAKTLAVMGTILAIMVLGITFLAYYYGIVPSATETVVSQIASHTFGRNIVYYLIQVATTIILVLAANTGFSAFPLLAVNLAKDKYLPRMFLSRGERLVFSNGILTLAVTAIILVFLFNGNTEHLIPLYAVGVFIPFTLSQTGMMVKWMREKPAGWVRRFLINTTGAIICFIVTSMFFITKLNQVWPVLIFLPLIVLFFDRIRNHYLAVGDQLRLCPDEPAKPIKGNIIIVPVSGITRVVENSLIYAKSLSPDLIIAVYVGFTKEETKKFEEKWKKWQPGVRLVTIYSSYRNINGKLGKFIDMVNSRAMKANYGVTVIIPQFLPKKGWHNILHNQSGLILREYLLHRKNVVVSTVPYHLKK